MGKVDSSVLYIPVCPTTKPNAEHIKLQRENFIKGTPSPDFPGGIGESRHLNRPGPDYLKAHTDIAGLRAAGFERLVAKDSETIGSKRVVEQANAILGF